MWRARFPDFHPGPDRLLLERGFHVAHVDTAGMLGGARAMEVWDRFYEQVRAEHGLAARPALEGVSRGGLFVYHWASLHPERVACLYTDTAVCDIRSWPLGAGRGRGHAPTWEHLLDELELSEAAARAYPLNPVERLGPMAAAGIPILALVSLDDEIVPPEENTLVVARRYRRLGGRIEVMTVEHGTPESGGHHFPHPDPLRVADFIEQHATVAPDGVEDLALRDGLDRCRRRFEERGRGRVAFLGGSITHNPGWRDQVCEYLSARFPETEFEFVAAGIPSMGSTPGAFRLARDVFGTGPVDLLFQEAAVNDSTNGRAAIEMTRGVEGIVRHARALSPDVDVVLLHFVDPAKVETIRGGGTPEVVLRHEAVARAYGLPSVDLAREVTRRIDAGQFTWEEDFVDLHPSPFGQRLYASSVRRLLAAAWAGPLPESPEPRELPPALDPHSYDRGALLDIGLARDLVGFERRERCDPRKGGVGGGVRPGFHGVPMLVAESPGASMVLPFTGRAVGVWVAAGPDAGRLRFRVDGGPWENRELFTPWSGGLHLPWVHVLAAELQRGEHLLEVRVDEGRHERSRGRAVRIVPLVVNR